MLDCGHLALIYFGNSMPKYELMYIIGSQISDNDIPEVTGEVKKYIEGKGGIIEKEEELGKKKLAYPIKHQKIGHYVAVNFDAPSDALAEIEHRIRTNQGIIRHLIINLEEALVRMEKDRKAQAKLKLVRPKIEEVRAAPARAGRKIEIDLDAEIEKALESEDLK